jgi:hypothetical protein
MKKKGMGRGYAGDFGEVLSARLISTNPTYVYVYRLMTYLAGTSRCKLLSFL